MAQVLFKIRRMQWSGLVGMPQALRTIIALVMREMATSYGRSPGGYLWAIAEPLAGIALLTALFAFAFQAPPLGVSFALFYASGLVPFLSYADVNGKLSQAINFSLPLLSYPRVTLVDAVLARALLNTMTQILVAALVFVGLFVFIDTQARIQIDIMALAMLLALSLGFGIGTLNCYLVTRFPVWQRIWSIANRPMFLLSCVVFTFETVPLQFQDWLWFNPLVHVVGLMRSGLYFGYDAPYVSALYVLGITGSSTVLGFFLIWRDKDKLLNR